MKGFFAGIAIAFMGAVVFSGCIKNKPYVTTSNPQMTATVDKYTFVASYVTTAIRDTQTQDSASTLIMTGYSSDKAHPFDKIELTVNRFRNTSQVFSIVQSQASAAYYHNGKYGKAIAGVVTITNYSPETITGYFSFDTNDTVHVRNGTFTVNKPQ